jgi:hypothetical protein
MLNAHFSLDAKAGTAHKSKMAKVPIRETITYPKIIVAEDNDSCLNPAFPFEHVLWCGHTVSTALPNEPCAPNCHHVQDDGGELDRSLRNRKAMKMKNGNEVSDKKFYCDACVETEMEHKILVELSASAAEERRAVMRANEAKTRGKTTKFRKCYIALKITSIPCHSDGSISSRYTPREERHQFDVALPRSGENMFEDVDPDATEDERMSVEIGHDFITRVKASRVAKAMKSPPKTAYRLVFSDEVSAEENACVANRKTRRADRREQGNHTPLTTSALRTSTHITFSPGTVCRVTDGTTSLDSRQDHNTAASQRAQRRNKDSRALDEAPSQKRNISRVDEENDDMYSSAEEAENAAQTNKKKRVAPLARQTGREQKKKTRRFSKTQEMV